MEGEAGAQVVTAQAFVHHRDLPPLARKRDFPWSTPRLSHAYDPPPQPPNWSSKNWTWDRNTFVARPIAAQEGEALSLKLGGGAASVTETTAAPVARPAKRVRSGSPGSGGGSYPMCQVDDCRADLSNAKDYHRRHKVCELHSKTTKALVSKQMQRFCQQCSRFHPLAEFDEGKRSCRRRLAGHNRRRRKTQPEDASSQLLLTGNRENGGNGGLDILNLLSILARLQGNGLDKGASVPSVPDKDRLINIINKISSVPKANSNGRAQVDGEFDLNVPQAPVAAASAVERNGASSGPATMDLLAVLSSALKSSKPEATTSISQGSSACTAEAKEKTNHVEHTFDVNACAQTNAPVFTSGATRNGCGLPSSMLPTERRVPEVRSKTLPLQLFSSTDDDSPPKAGSFGKYLSSESSNPMEERSPSSSPPIVRKFFPMNSETEKNDHSEDATMVEVSTSQRWSPPFEAMKKVERRAQNGAVQYMPYHAGYTSSSSGSDHSPSSSNSDAYVISVSPLPAYLEIQLFSDWLCDGGIHFSLSQNLEHDHLQDRTGRIIFKLFDKNPSDLPGTLRGQIFNWLSHIPTEMESYIRPGCVVLSLYLSMPPLAWDRLKEDLSQKVNELLQSDGSQFWKSGRFLVYTDRRLASHKDGTIRFCKSWKTWSTPEIMSVSPLAVVSGKETTILLHGRNLTVPGTKIHCTYLGGYTSKEILGSAHEGTIYDDSCLESFNFPGGPPDIFGRCFVEVENGFKGNSFPVIIASDSICAELRVLESELENLRSSDAIMGDPGQDRSLKSRNDILHFLNELGWLFQRRDPLSKTSIKDFSCVRFKYLLIFSVERDWPVLTLELLNLLADRSAGDDDLARESLEALLEIQLLSRAVKRKCRKMVDLLLNYSVVHHGIHSSRAYIFPPNLAGPSGFTPLHLAASCKGCEDMVDALTSDPQGIGLSCWNSCYDDDGHTPLDFATMANNHSYNELVGSKISDRENHQISIHVEESSLDESWIVREPEQGGDRRPVTTSSSCRHCSMIEYRKSGGTIHYQGLLRRPYIHSMLAIAAVCVCVCLFLRGAPHLGTTAAPFKWENVEYGPR